MQRFADDRERGSSVPSLVHDVLSSPGQPLAPPIRSAMESRLGHDFSRVRVHVDRRAAESAGALNALAYTVGDNVVFARGRFAPNTRQGSHLLAHELAHVIQQDGATGGRRGGELKLNEDDAAERAAEIAAGAAAGSIVATRPTGLRVPALALQRQAETEPDEPLPAGDDCASDCQSYCPDVARHFIRDHWPEWVPVGVSSTCDFGPGRLWTCPVDLTLASRDKPDCTETFHLTVIWNGDGHRLRVDSGGGLTVYDYTCGDGLRLTRVAEPFPHAAPNPYTCL